MEQLKMHAIDYAKENVQKVAQLFPNCVTETANGLAIDFEKLQQELSEEVMSGSEERYQFTWPGKRAAIREANSPCYLTLRPSREDSVDFDKTKNLYIEGDNLQVLKLLRESYLGKVKMIYIDPPYNTGNDFVYNDDFSRSATEYKEVSNMFDDDGNMLLQNYEINSAASGRFHSDWLNMMYPRIQVAKDLLQEDGLVFISIDDKEVCNLKKICDELFGGINFVGNIIWQSRTSISNDDEISTNHNHTLIYSKNRSLLKFGGDDIDASEYTNPDNDPRGPWKLVPLDANHVGGDTYYPIRNPKTGVDYYPPKGRIWCFNRASMQKLMNDGRIKFGMTDDSSPKKKLFYNERMEKGDCKTPSSILLDAGTTQSGTDEIMSLFEGEKIFDYPKPSTLINRLLKYGFVRKDDLVLDFFSGSGTTAHGVFRYIIESKHNCNFILVQLPEDLDNSLALADNDAKKTIKNAIEYLDKIGKRHTICEIGKERIRRAGKKIKEEAGEAAKELDTGFRVLKLASSNMNDVYYTPQDTNLNDLFAENIKSDRTPEDLLFQVLPELNLPLSAKIVTKTIAGKQVFVVEDNYLAACFDEDITDECITAIAKTQPYHFVMRESGAHTDQVLDNFDQLFKAYSKHTITHVL